MGERWRVMAGAGKPRPAVPHGNARRRAAGEGCVDLALPNEAGILANGALRMTRLNPTPYPKFHWHGDKACEVFRNSCEGDCAD